MLVAILLSMTVTVTQLPIPFAAPVEQPSAVAVITTAGGVIRPRRTFTAEHRQRIGEANRKRIVRDETRLKQSASLKTYLAAHPEAITSRQETMKANWMDATYRDRILASRALKPHPMLGKHHAPEAREKMSAGQRGKPLSPARLAHWRKVIAANRGRHYHQSNPCSPEIRKRMGEARRGVRNASFGRPPTEAQRKANEAKRGKKLHLSLAQRERRSSIALSRWQDPDCRRRIMASQLRGPQHPNWRDGASHKPYPSGWTETLRRSIRERDHHACQLCGKPQSNKAHDVHHIDYVKSHYTSANLITLCHRCHAKTNIGERALWVSIFSLIQEERGIGMTAESEVRKEETKQMEVE